MNVTPLSRYPATGAARDEGVALVVAIFLVLAFSTIGISLLTVSPGASAVDADELTAAQARHGAESGVLRTVNYLTQTYRSPGHAGDPYERYDTSASPVMFNGEPVRLSTIPNESSNYPDAEVIAAFASVGQGTFDAGRPVDYRVRATLVSMRVVEDYASSIPIVIQSWRVDGVGALDDSRGDDVEVSAMLDREVASAYEFGIYATASHCGAVTLGGVAVHDSYDSSALSFRDRSPITQLSGGRLGTNGNLTAGGNAEIWGTLSTPRAGAGRCRAGAVTATTGATRVHEGLHQLSNARTFAIPPPPAALPRRGHVSWSGSSCAALGFAAPTCTGSAGSLTLDPQGGTLTGSDVSIDGGATVTLKAGTYHLNSLKVSGHAKVIIASGPVFLHIAGVETDRPIDFQGGEIQNPSFDPTTFHILYGGTSELAFTGGQSSAALVYAPNAGITLAGGAHWYGSIVGAEVRDTAGVHFHYDRRLKKDFMVAGNYTLSPFSWTRHSR